jgi:hypothetical protein
MAASDMESTGNVAWTGSAGRPSNGVAPISAPTASVPGAAGALFGVGLTATILPKQHLELRRAQPGVGSNRAHGARVDGVVSGNRKAHAAVVHDDVLPLPQDHEAGFFSARTAGSSLTPGIFGMESDRDDPLYDGEFRPFL